MKNGALKVWIEQVAGKIKEELGHETDTERVCALLDAKEYLRRAWCTLDYSPVNAVDTTEETRLAIHGADTDWRGLATEQLREHAKGVSRES